MEIKSKKMVIRYLIRQLGLHIIFLLVLLIASNNYIWINAWYYSIFVLCGDSIENLILSRTNPRLLNSRAQLINPGTKKFDKIFVSLYPIVSLACTVTAGLDQRINKPLFTEFSILVIIIGSIVMIIGYVIGIWAMSVNHHFEMTVFIKQDGSQQVCSSGPYRVVRHPGYLSILIVMPIYPLILESTWAMIPVIILMTIFVIRTYLEDKTLQAELPGYKEYTSSTKYRLIPHVW